MSIFNCCEPPTCDDDLGDDVYTDQVDCFADLTLPQPGGVAAGTRFIVKNVEPIINIDPSWINLPAGLQENDIIEKDSQNLNWILATDVSAEGPGQLTYVKCKGFYYWWNGFSWMEISPSAFCGLCERDDYTPTEGQISHGLVHHLRSMESRKCRLMHIQLNLFNRLNQTDWQEVGTTVEPLLPLYIDQGNEGTVENGAEGLFDYIDGSARTGTTWDGTGSEVGFRDQTYSIVGYNNCSDFADYVLDVMKNGNYECSMYEMLNG